MIHEIAVDLQAQLAARGCPIKVYDGPEATSSVAYSNERVVVEHSEQGDAFSAVAGARGGVGTTRAFYTRTIGIQIRIVAQSPRANASKWEHRRRAENILDLVVNGLHKVARERKAAIGFGAGRFAYETDLEGSEIHPGAVYVLNASVSREVTDRDWDGTSAVQTGEITDKNNTTQVRFVVGGTASTSCGA